MTDNIKIVPIWFVKYLPQNIPLWAGPNAALPKNYYFKDDNTLNEFLEKNEKLKSYFQTSKIIAIQYGESFYPLNEKIIFT